MAMTTRRYGKPCMTNIQGKLGVDIIREIRKTPPPDREAMRVKKERALIRLKTQAMKDHAELRDDPTSFSK